MKELSIFIDESGDFGEYDYHSPWYIVSMVFHDQENSIQEPLEHLEKELSLLGLKNHCVHTGPIIRKEEDYSAMSYLERRKIFNKMVMFLRQSGIKYKTLHIEKKHVSDIVEVTGKLSKPISLMLLFVFSRYPLAAFILKETIYCIGGTFITSLKLCINQFTLIKCSKAYSVCVFLNSISMENIAER